MFVIVASLKMRTTPGWVWTLFNGIAALALGILVYLGWPSSSFSVLGFFFGINLFFKVPILSPCGFVPQIMGNNETQKRNSNPTSGP